LDFVYGKSCHLEKLNPYKVSPAPTYTPNCWETRVLYFEALAGVITVASYISPSFDGRYPKDVACVLGENICVRWSGHLYADKLIDELSLSDSGVTLRVGLTHYNMVKKVNFLFEELS